MAIIFAIIWGQSICGYVSRKVCQNRNTRRTKRTFSPEFKLEAIEQMVKYQRDVREVALALELNPDHLRKWIRLYKQELQGIENAITPEQREIQQLKAQIKSLKMEKEILKQTAVLMSEIPGKVSR